MKMTRTHVMRENFNLISLLFNESFIDENNGKCLCITSVCALIIKIITANFCTFNLGSKSFPGGRNHAIVSNSN